MFNPQLIRTFTVQMRSVAYILLFVISFLTVQPLVAASCKKAKTENCCSKKAKSCCSKKEKGSCKKEKEEGGCCSKGVCGSCMTCACCLIATLEKASDWFVSETMNKDLINTLNKNAHQGFLPSPFQPPEHLAV